MNYYREQLQKRINDIESKLLELKKSLNKGSIETGKWYIITPQENNQLQPECALIFIQNLKGKEGNFGVNHKLKWLPSSIGYNIPNIIEDKEEDRLILVSDVRVADELKGIINREGGEKFLLDIIKQLTNDSTK